MTDWFTFENLLRSFRLPFVIGLGVMGVLAFTRAVDGWEKLALVALFWPFVLTITILEMRQIRPKRQRREGERG